MAITVTDNRVAAGLVDRADSVTGWSSPVGGNSPTLYTTDPVPKELTGHIGIVTSNEEMDMLHTHASTNLSAGVLVYVWAANYGIQDTTANYGIAVILGDGTNTNAYQIGGLDKAVFRHAEGAAVNYQCLLIDTGSLPTGKALRGTFGSFDDTQITEFGADFATTLKSVGGVENCFIDQILYGDGGLTIIGTDTATVLEDLSVIDASDTSDTSYGICRNNGGGIFGVQGQLLFGDTGSGTDTMSIQDQTLAFEDFSGVGTDKFGLTWQGGSGTQTFVIDNSTIFCPAGTGAFFTATETDVESLDATNSNFLNIDQGFDLTTDGTNGPNWDWSNNKFVGCSQIDIGTTAFADNIIDSTTDANGGMLISSTTSLTNVSGLSFISDSTGHAILITATGTYTFTTFTYTGYGASATTDASVFNNSGGLVTINVTGGDTPTVRNGSGASTNVVSSVDVDVHVEDTGGTDIENAQVFIRKAADNYSYTSDSGNAAGDADFVVNETVDTDLPQSSWLHVWDASTNTKQNYRYASWTGLTFTLLAEITGSATSAGSATSLISTSTNFLSADIEEGDTIRNTTDGEWAVVDEIVDADNITTSELSGGATWDNTDAFSFHRLAIAYADNDDRVDIPLFNGQTNSTGDISTTFGGTTPSAITVRIRSNEDTTKYVPFTTSGSITSTGFSLTALLTEDTVAT